jgi:hypothetical protein
MTKDSVEGELIRYVFHRQELTNAEQIVYNGKKKMVLDHLVVQNLGKDSNEEEDVSSMLLAGAKALYDTSISDVTYTTKQVEEMIDKVEKEAEDEALVLEEKWAKEDSMTDEEKLAALNTKGSETMSFAFAKIWEMNKGDLGELETGIEERLEDEMDDNWMTVWENAERERARRLEADAQLNKNERRKRIDYAFDDTTPRKKPGRPKGSKDKDKDKDKGPSRAASVISQFPSSDGEFHIGEGDISADDSGDEAIPEGILDLAMGGRNAIHIGTMKKKKSELNKMERKALRKKLEEELIRKAQESHDQAHAMNGEPGTLAPAMTSESFFADLKERDKKGTLNKLEKKALKKNSKENLDISHAASVSNLANSNGAGPSTATGPLLVTGGQATETPNETPGPVYTTPQAETVAAWVQKALKEKAGKKARAELRKGLEQAMQATRVRDQAAAQATVPAPAPGGGKPNGESEAKRAADRAWLVSLKRQADRDVEDIERGIYKDVHGVGTWPGPSSAAQNDRDVRQEAEDLQRAIHNPTHGVGSRPGPSTSALTPQQPIAGPSTTRSDPVPIPASREPALIQMARTVSQAQQITKAQVTIAFMFQHLTEFGLKKELKVWARMVMSEIPPMERKALYSTLARTLDRRLVECGHDSYFSDSRHKVSLEVLFDQRAPGVKPAESGSGGVPRIPDGIGRLNNHRAQVANTNNHDLAGNEPIPIPGAFAGPSTTHVNGQTQPQTGTLAGDIARPSAQLSLQTPQQRAAMAKAAIDPPISASSVTTQPRQSMPQPSSSQPQRHVVSSQLPTQTQGRPIDIPCSFCRKIGHGVLECADRLARPVSVLRAQIEACEQSLANKSRPPRKTALEINRLVSSIQYGSVGNDRSENRILMKIVYGASRAV